MEITTRNANTLFEDMFWKFKTSGMSADSRNGPVIRIVEPVLTTIANPMERVLFHGERDANPVFHLMESIWMLAGRRDVGFVQQFNSKIGQYSDDGEVFNAAYGYRWRHHFGHDQLLELITKLQTDRDTRQAVLQMWDSKDLSKDTKDRACNMQLIFEILHGKLNMTVINRSNDAWYGYCGANVVHFTVLQEFVASAVGVKLGVYRTFTTNLHLYTELYDARKFVDNPPSSEAFDMYQHGVKPMKLMFNNDWVSWLEDAEAFCNNPFKYDNSQYSFFTEVAHPMAMISYERKNKISDGMKWADRVEAEDWRIAAQDWIERREAAKKQ